MASGRSPSRLVVTAWQGYAADVVGAWRSGDRFITTMMRRREGEALAWDRDTAERTGRRTLRPLAQLLPYLRPYGLQIVGASVALTVSAGTVLSLGQGLRTLVDQGFSEGDAALLDRALLVLVGAVVVLAVSTYARFFLVSWIGERLVADLRRVVYGHVVRLSPGFFETTRTAEVASRLTADTAVLQTVIGSSVSIFLRNALMLVGGLALLVVTSPRLTGLVILVVPMVIVPIILFGRRVRRLSRDSQDRIADVGAQVEESLFAIRTVQAFGHETLERNRMRDAAESAFATAKRRIATRAFLIATVIVLVFGAVGAILYAGGRDVLAGRISGGELSAFVFYSVLVAGATGALSEVLGEIQRAAGATERLLELLNTPPQIAAPAHPQPLPTPARGAIAFDRVVFHYPSRPDQPALNGLDLTVEPGTRIALVGPSGAGKTTVFQLLLRFYDPQSGGIRIDGVDLRQADPADIRSRIGLVPQDPVLFTASAGENIRYGRPDASADEVRAAADAANALGFIDALPAGLDTPLGEKGVRLSGGQRQRIAIARAVLRDPAVLLLDEATSALDAESEQAVQSALEALMRNRTTLVIAHRLATVQHVDRIVVMDRGTVVGVGAHEDLVRQDGLYARLAALQFNAAA